MRIETGNNIPKKVADAITNGQPVQSVLIPEYYLDDGLNKGVNVIGACQEKEVMQMGKITDVFFPGVHDATV